MKTRLAGIRNGIELYVPVPGNESEKRELELREKRFANFLADIILKYYSKIADEIDME